MTHCGASDKGYQFMLFGRKDRKPIRIVEKEISSIEDFEKCLKIADKKRKASIERR